MELVAKPIHITVLSVLALVFIIGNGLLNRKSLSGRLTPGDLPTLQNDTSWGNGSLDLDNNWADIEYCAMRLHWPQTRCLVDAAEDTIECDAVLFVTATDDERLSRLHAERLQWVQSRQQYGDQMCYVTLRLKGPARHKLGRGFAKYKAGLVMSEMVTSGRIKSRGWRSTEAPWILQMEYDSTPVNPRVGFIDILRRLEMGLVQRTLEEINCQAEHSKCYEPKRQGLSAPAFFAALSFEPTCQQPKGGVTGSVIMYQPGPHIALIFHSVIEAATLASGRHARDLPWFNQVVTDLAGIERIPKVCDLPILPRTRLLAKRNVSLAELLNKTTPAYAQDFLHDHRDDIQWLQSLSRADRALAVVHPRWFNSLACPDDLSKRSKFALHDDDFVAHYLSCTTPSAPQPQLQQPLQPNPAAD